MLDHHSRRLSQITYSIENTSALIMVDVRIQVVNTDRIDTKNLHESSISHAFVFVTERISSAGRIVTGTASRLVGHTNNLEFVASLGVDEVSSLDFQRRHGADNRGPKGHEGGFDLVRMSICGVTNGNAPCTVARGEWTYKHSDNVLLNLSVLAFLKRRGNSARVDCRLGRTQRKQLNLQQKVALLTDGAGEESEDEQGEP